MGYLLFTHLDDYLTSEALVTYNVLLHRSLELPLRNIYFNEYSMYRIDVKRNIKRKILSLHMIYVLWIVFYVSLGSAGKSHDLRTDPIIYMVFLCYYFIQHAQSILKIFAEDV